MVIEFDLFGQEHSYYRLSDIDMPKDPSGCVVISHDICYRTRLTRYGGHGYGHIFANVMPMMLRRGFNPAEVDRIMVDTPRRLLTFI